VCSEAILAAFFEQLVIKRQIGKVGFGAGTLLRPAGQVDDNPTICPSGTGLLVILPELAAGVMIACYKASRYLSRPCKPDSFRIPDRPRTWLLPDH
jgi:hypothetical protein